MAERFTLHRMWEAADADALLGRLAPGLRAVATKGELGASAALMDKLPKLEIVACYGVGVDAIDLPRARERGIRVTNTPDVLTEEVADMAWALLLATARRIPAGDAHVRSGAWAEGAMAMTTRVWGKRLGIVGLGNIGRAVAKRAEGFGMRIAYSGRSRREDAPYDWHPDPASLAAASDILVVCASGGAGTRGLVDAKAIAALGPAGILVNVSRGTVVDEAALLDALGEGPHRRRGARRVPERAADRRALPGAGERRAPAAQQQRHARDPHGDGLAGAGQPAGALRRPAAADAGGLTGAASAGFQSLSAKPS